ncbi:MAG TPA: sigma-70 family RNA polymerase sigma factor [Myxococcales bacterium]|nr:sigma-70 family RNA polymerase sigma factor [Myxococcales bacterium]
MLVTLFIVVALTAALAAVAASNPDLQDRGRELVGRAARGDRQALRRLYDLYSPSAMAIALRMLKNRPMAEEVVQDAFLEVWRRAREYDAARGTVSAWIATISRTRALDRLRADARLAAAKEKAAAQPETPSVAPLELAVERQQRERVNAALGTLPAEQRLAIELAYFDGLTQREIAEKLGQPLGTVKTRVRLAMEKLAVVLCGPQGDGEVA